jgi:hypothetical protein
MGFPLRSFQGIHVFLHYPGPSLHVRKRTLHRSGPETWYYASNRVGDTGIPAPRWHVRFAPVHGREDQRLQHLHFSCKLPERPHTSLLYRCLSCSCKSLHATLNSIHILTSCQPLAIGILGVFFFVLNAFFALIILLRVIWALVMGILSKNPETRYRPVHDDRGSFMKSQSNINDVTELDALAATARGEKSRRMDLDDADHDDIGVKRPMASRDTSSRATDYSVLSGRGSGSQLLPGHAIERHANSSPFGSSSIHQHRQANNSSPWKTGVGY